MNIQHTLILTLLFSLVAACGTPFEKMTPEDFSKASDKFICDYLPPPDAGGHYIQFENFRNEVDARGLSSSKCCLKNIQNTPLYCYGYIKGGSEEFYDLASTDNVDLIFDKKDISRSYEIMGKVVDKWTEKDPSQRYGLETSINLFNPSAWSSKISRQVIKDRFEKTYKKRAQEVGADALLVDGSSVIKAPSPRLWSGAKIPTGNNLSFTVIFHALKYKK